MAKELIKIVNDTKCPKVYISGYIGDDEDDSVDYNSIRSAFDQLKQYPRIECYINCGGGSMTEGFAIYDHVQMIKAETKLFIDVVVIGMAASMATVLMCIGDTISMTANSNIMFHKPQASVNGEAQALLDMAKLTNDLEERAIEVYKNRFKIDEATIKGWMVPGKQTWFTAKEALELKIIDKITNSITNSNIDIPTAKFKDTATAKDVWNSVYNKIQISQIPMKLPKNTLDKLKLPEDSSDDAVISAIDNLVVENKAKDDQIKAFKDAETERTNKAANTLVDNAIAAKKITAAEKDTYVKFALNDYDAAKSIMDKLKAPALPGNVITPGKDGDAGKDDRSAWTFDKWRKEDSKGLAKMRVENAEAYDALIEAHKTVVNSKINIKQG